MQRNRKRNRLSTLIGLVLAGLVAAGTASADLAVGDEAPDFELKGSDGETYTLSGLLAKHQGVVLAWFPKAFTPG
jgi:peroxiredoxin Q/BCP